MESVISPIVKQWGDGDRARVLLIHGLAAYSGAWWLIGSRLAAAGCTVVAPDLRGHGSSPSTEWYGFSAMSADVASLGAGWDLIVGHSLGGPIACLVAAKDPSTRAVLLLDPFLDAPDEAFDGLVGDLLSELDPHATAGSIAAEQPDWHAEDCFHKAVGARLTGPYVVERCLLDNTPYHHLELLDTLDVPVQILGSDPNHGALFSPDAIEHVTNGSVRYRMVAGTGHSLQRERPDVVVDTARATLGV
ncbi:MAG: alpha/beta hydrolase [Acidimicrobiia bacterium]|nr:alpha/beta hydrolase [Acidimicrobiia bacterium]